MISHSNELENIKKWINALESGDYQQTTGRLRRGDAMCCLGVACDISDISNWTKNDRYMGEKDVLPNNVMAWLGISKADVKSEVNEGLFYYTHEWILSLPEHIKNKLEPILSFGTLSNAVDNNEHSYLSMLNDRGWTFKEIAELIRSNPPGLFNTDVVLQWNIQHNSK